MSITGRYTKPQSGGAAGLDDLLDSDSYYPLPVDTARLFERGKNRTVLLRYRVGDSVSGEFFNQGSLYLGNMIEACELNLGFTPEIDEDATRERIQRNDPTLKDEEIAQKVRQALRREIYEQFCDWAEGNTFIIGKSKFGSRRAKPRWGIMAELTAEAIENGDIPPINGGEDAQPPEPFAGGSDDAEAAKSDAESSSDDGEDDEDADPEEDDPVRLLNQLTNSQQKNFKARIESGKNVRQLIDALKRDVGLTQHQATVLVSYGRRQWGDDE